MEGVTSTTSTPDTITSATSTSIELIKQVGTFISKKKNVFLATKNKIKTTARNANIQKCFCGKTQCYIIVVNPPFYSLKHSSCTTEYTQQVARLGGFPYHDAAQLLQHYPKKMPNTKMR